MPSIPPATLTSLPSEVLGQIAEQLDLHSITSFAFTCRSAWLSVPNDDRVKWLTINLESRRWVLSELRRMMTHGTRQRWAAVRSVTAKISPHVSHSLLQVIANVSPNVMSLDVEDNWRNAWGFHSLLDYFDLRLITSGLQLSFPMLTHLRLGGHTVYLVESINDFCRMAPKLVSLDFCFISDPDETDEIDVLKLIDRMPRDLYEDTKLLSLRIDYECGREDDVGECGSCQVIVGLLKHCPRLQTLSVKGETLHGALKQSTAGPFSGISGVAELRQLHWDVRGSKIGDMLGAPGKEVSLHLQRLIISSWAWSIPPCPLPPLPSLEIALFSHQLWTNLPMESDVYRPVLASPHEHLNPTLAAWLRHTLNLRIFHYRNGLTTGSMSALSDHLEACDHPEIPSGLVRSIRHGDEEVLRVRLVLREIEVEIREPRGIKPEKKMYGPEGHEGEIDACEDDECEESEEETESEQGHGMVTHRVIHVAGEPCGEGTEDDEDAPDPVIVVQEVTDWEGATVPAEILDKMRVVEGISRDAWDRRGVEVGDEAWKVLMDWKSGVAI